ncbi:MAG: hypothetical protein KGJ06_07290, partial [Pseudomonadota bacterium]|nr:hypothetical protein [Pseudomonadota bacterium]
LAIMPLGMAWADSPTNVCKPDPNSPNVTDTVLCTWPNDPSAYPLPDFTNCQAVLRIPTSSSDDCGNSDFLGCMQNLGFQCSETQSSS